MMLSLAVAWLTLQLPMTRPQRTACGDVAKGSAATVPGLVTLMLPHTPTGIFVTHNMAFLSHSAWHFLSHTLWPFCHGVWHCYHTKDGIFMSHRMAFLSDTVWLGGFSHRMAFFITHNMAFLFHTGLHFCHAQHGIFISHRMAFSSHTIWHRMAFLSHTLWHFFLTQDSNVSHMQDGSIFTH